MQISLFHFHKYVYHFDLYYLIAAILNMLSYQFCVVMQVDGVQLGAMLSLCLLYAGDKSHGEQPETTPWMKMLTH